MLFIFDRYGNLIESNTDENLVQYSVGATTLYAQFKDIDVNEYLPYISFQRADGSLSTEVAMSYAGNSISYHFSDEWITEKAGILKCAISLKQDGVVKRTATFNLNVENSVSWRSTPLTESAALNELELRTYALEKGFATILENGSNNVRLVEDKVTNQIELEPKNYTDYTYSSNNIVSVTIKFTDIIGQGFISGLNFKADADGMSFGIVNNTDYDIVIWKNGLQTSQFPAFLNQIVNIVFLCDGLTIHCYLRLTNMEE